MSFAEKHNGWRLSVIAPRAPHALSRHGRKPGRRHIEQLHGPTEPRGRRRSGAGRRVQFSRVWLASVADGLIDVAVEPATEQRHGHGRRTRLRTP